VSYRLHPTSQQVLAKITAINLPQALLLIGPAGAGLEQAAEFITSQVKGQSVIVLPEKNDIINLQEGIIAVESIRNLYKNTRTRQTKPYIIIIDFAETMTIQAQNAFLKLLEEPNDFVHFILLAHNSAKLLSTVLSRLQKITIKPITKEQSEKLLDDLNVEDVDKRKKLLFIAEGLPAKIKQLAEDDSYFQQQSSIMSDARRLLQSSVYDKLVIIQTYKSSRQAALQLLDNLINILQRDLSRKVQPLRIAQIDMVLAAYERIKSNGNVRLTLTQAVL
jgi:DNA polymerase-3 subunit delta'